MKENSTFRKIHNLLKIVVVLLPLAFAGNVIYMLIASKPGFWRELSRFKIGYFLLAIILSLIPWFAQTLRITIWSRVFNKPLRFTRTFRTVLASDIAAAATPTMLGGGYAKAGLLIYYGFSAAEATTITLLGTVVDGFFFALALPLAVFWSQAWNNPYVISAWNGLLSRWPIVLTVIIVLSVILFFLRRTASRTNNSATSELTSRPVISLNNIGVKIRGFWNDLGKASVLILRKGKLPFLFAVIAAGIGWCSRYGTITVLVWGLGYDADPVLLFLLQWVVFTTMTMIPTPGAVGGAEVSFALVHNGLIPSHVLPIVTTGWRFMTFYLPVGLGSLIFSSFGSIGDKELKITIDQAEPERVLSHDNPGK